MQKHHVFKFIMLIKCLFLKSKLFNPVTKKNRKTFKISEKKSRKENDLILINLAKVTAPNKTLLKFKHYSNHLRVFNY